jgi:endoglucanase
MQLVASIFFAGVFAASVSAAEGELYLRANQLGYLPAEQKIGIVFSRSPLPETFAVVASADHSKTVFTGRAVKVESGWGQFAEHAELDFSKLRKPGRYVLVCGKAVSLPFEVGEEARRSLTPDLLYFMRQQRCGYNPWLDAKCHQFDGRTAYGPLTNASYVDSRGGWHDAADQLKYLLTSGNATAQMLLAYQLGRTKRGHGKSSWELDEVNAMGQAGANGVPDLLDEARWGLEWMLKLHPQPDHLYHQVADDRDHIGRRLPPNEIADYGWGKGSYRVVYFADGEPQGLDKYKSESTGVANLAGRYAAAMGLAYQIWKNDPQQREFAERCLRAGMEVYELGRAKEGVQQGNSFKAPYRYEETTWADDMEWGAAELYRATRKRQYLDEAKQYAELAGTESWMGKEQARHYQYYPFMNLGHFRLYELVDRAFKKRLAGYYREGIEQCVKAGERNAYRIGVPFIWCSNNLTTALATQCLLYELMTGDTRYRDFAAHQRDWLLGRNPWGYTMFTEIGAVSPKDPHLMTMQITKRPVRGGLVDGPVYDHIFKSLKGVGITEPDPLARFHGPAVYHDDVQDYSTNEPTMDGTASAILLWVLAEVGS